MNVATIWLKHLIPALQAIQDEINALDNQAKEAEKDRGAPAKEREGVTETRPRLLSVPEAAAFLGLKVPTIYQLTCSRRIPFYKVGTRTMFKERQLLDWLEGFAVEAIGSPGPRNRRRA
jgi:excisionase family DNA binding protein